MVELKVRDELPPLRRGGGKKKTEETQQYIEAIKSGKVIYIDNIAEQKDYDAMGQRIRSAAKSVNLKVTIRREQDDNGLLTLSFQGKDENGDNIKVETTENNKQEAKATTKTTK